MSYNTMVFYVTVDPKGLRHVQNMITGMLGQHHVHTKAGFQKWVKKSNIPLNDIFGWSPGKKVVRKWCRCSLQAGWTREYDGHTWYDKRFL